MPNKNGNQISMLSKTLSPAGSSSPGLSLTNGVAPGFEVFAYDGFNRLISANIGGIDTVYTYNPDGLRHSKSTNNVTTIHVWDGSNISLDIVGSSAVKYVRGINLIASEESGTRKYYLYNAHGDVVKLSSSTGQLLWSYDYDAFGNDTTTTQNGGSGSTDSNPFRFAGEYWDSENGTYYLRARYYDPANSRMLSEDPARDGLNWYTYCANNPISYVDPTGCIIQLTGSKKDKNAALAGLQELTDYKLDYDKNGNVFIVESDIEDEKYESGNELIKRMIDNTDYTTTIKINRRLRNGTCQWTSTGAFDGTGSDAIVTWNLGFEPYLIVSKSDMRLGTLNVREETPSYIVLAHELIHADNGMRGVGYGKTDPYTHTVSVYITTIPGYGPQLITKTSTASKEEFATVGLFFTQNGSKTENDIRKEHGLPPRSQY